MQFSDSDEARQTFDSDAMDCDRFSVQGSNPFFDEFGAHDISGDSDSNNNDDILLNLHNRATVGC